MAHGFNGRFRGYECHRVPRGWNFDGENSVEMTSVLDCELSAWLYGHDTTLDPYVLFITESINANCVMLRFTNVIIAAESYVQTGDELRS